MIKHTYFKILIMLFIGILIVSYLVLEDTDNNIVEVDNSQEESSDEKDLLGIENENMKQNTLTTDVSTADLNQGDTIFDEEQNIEYKEYVITHEKDGSSYKIHSIYTLSQEIKIFDENGIEIQSIEVGFGDISEEPKDVNFDGYTDIVVRTGGTVNETHDLYIWDNETHSFVKVIYEGVEMLAWFTAYEGYVENFIRGYTPEESKKERLIWEGNRLIIDNNE